MTLANLIELSKSIQMLIEGTINMQPNNLAKSDVIFFSLFRRSIHLTAFIRGS